MTETVRGEKSGVPVAWKEETVELEAFLRKYEPLLSADWKEGTVGSEVFLRKYEEAECENPEPDCGHYHLSTHRRGNI